MAKTNPGRFFEDYRIGQVIPHAVPRTVAEGERALYHALYPARHALYSSDVFAQGCGLDGSPIDDLAAFHVVFGKTVPDISLNAVANLGYAEARFLQPVWPGDTLRSVSEVIGLKENSNGKTGVVWVRSTGLNQNDELVIPAGLDFTGYDFALAGEPHRCGDYAIGEIIDHVDGVTLEEAEHIMATRLWQNTSKVHFDATLRTSSALRGRCRSTGWRMPRWWPGSTPGPTPIRPLPG